MSESEAAEFDIEFDQRVAAVGLDPVNFEQVIEEMKQLAIEAGAFGHTLLISKHVAVGRLDDTVFRSLLESESQVDRSLILDGSIVPPEDIIAEVASRAGLPHSTVVQSLEVWASVMGDLFAWLEEKLDGRERTVLTLNEVEIRDSPDGPFESEFKTAAGRIVADLGQLSEVLLERRGLRRREPSEPISISGSPRRYWIWVNRPEYIHEVDGSIQPELDPDIVSDQGGWRTCSKDTKAGDLVMVYRSHSDRGIVGIVQATSDAYSIVGNATAQYMGWKWGCDYQAVALFDNHVPLEAIRNDKSLATLNALRASFQSKSYAVEADQWTELVRLAVTHNPSQDLPAGLLETTVQEPDALPWDRESEVEDWLESNLDVLEGFELPVVLLQRQRHLAVSGGILDLLCENADSGSLVVIELKAPGIRASRRTLGQVLGYMGGIAAEFPDREIEGVVIADGYEPEFELALEFAPAVRFIDLHQLRAS